MSLYFHFSKKPKSKKNQEEKDLWRRIWRWWGRNTGRGRWWKGNNCWWTGSTWYKYRLNSGRGFECWKYDRGRYEFHGNRDVRLCMIGKMKVNMDVKLWTMIGKRKGNRDVSLSMIVRWRGNRDVLDCELWLVIWRKIEM